MVLKFPESYYAVTQISDESANCNFEILLHCPTMNLTAVIVQIVVFSACCTSYRLHSKWKVLNIRLKNKSGSKFHTCSAAQHMIGKPWWEDDLPNILGINPIEAAVIFGALYYVYGSAVLYEYAREAGKLFSTIAPVVKDVSTNLFSEFREYFEEDRERDAMRKSGVDIDSIPRRTSNVIERVQTGLQVSLHCKTTGIDFKE